MTGLTSFVILILILTRKEETNSNALGFCFFSTIFAITSDHSLENYSMLNVPDSYYTSIAVVLPEATEVTGT